MTTHPHICPNCGQDMLLPAEFNQLHLTPTQALVLLRLYQAGPKGIHAEAHRFQHKTTLSVYVCIVRAALKDVGAEWTIQCKSQIYRLVRTNANPDHTPEREEAVYPRPGLRDVRGRSEGS